MRLCTFSKLLIWSGMVVGAPPLTAQRRATPDVTHFLTLDRDAEIRLARTAAPPFISDSATVLVLERRGYTQATRGNNGFTCVVIRSLGGSLVLPWLWNPKISAPHCYNPPAARTVMPVVLKQTEWLLSGENASEVASHIERAYATREFSPPAAGSMAYMLSPEQYLTDSGSHWLPHLMFFYDKRQPATVWGARASDAPVIDGSAGDPRAPFLTLFIPMREWSNGARADAPPAAHP